MDSPLRSRRLLMAKRSKGDFFVLVGILAISAAFGVGCGDADPDSKASTPDPCESVSCGAFGYCQNGTCECMEGHSGESCEKDVQLTACCQCLSSNKRVGGRESCLAIEIATCEARATFQTQCACWESCYSECRDVGYPYSGPPNGCAP